MFTARLVMKEEFDLPLVLTVEASFFCGSQGEYKYRHFDSTDFLRFVLNFIIKLVEMRCT